MLEACFFASQGEIVAMKKATLMQVFVRLQLGDMHSCVCSCACVCMHVYTRRATFTRPN